MKTEIIDNIRKRYKFKDTEALNSMVPFKKNNEEIVSKLLNNQFNKYKNNYNIAFHKTEKGDEELPLINSFPYGQITEERCLDVTSQSLNAQNVLNANDTIIVANQKSEETKEASESSWSIALQIFFPYLIAGFGTVGAGMVLDVVQHWPVFIEVRELFILVPALLGLKGNLEMTLASRLSTHANIIQPSQKKTEIKNRPNQSRKFTNIAQSTSYSPITNDSADKKDSSMKNILTSKINDIKNTNNKCISSWPSLIAGNMALIQGQASVIGFLAAFTAIIMGWIPEGHFDRYNTKILFASSILTASLASAILGIIMVLVVTLSRRCNLNPDNIATPIAASLGDLITLSLLGFIARHVSFAMPTSPGICYYVVLVYAILTPLWLYICYRNIYTHEVVKSGWSPIIYAMLISSMGGFILDFTVHRFRGIAVFQPVINGVGGNLAAIQASRLSTQLHTRSLLRNKQIQNVSSETEETTTTLSPVPDKQNVGNNTRNKDVTDGTNSNTITPTTTENTNYSNDENYSYADNDNNNNDERASLNKESNSKRFQRNSLDDIQIKNASHPTNSSIASQNIIGNTENTAIAFKPKGIFKTFFGSDVNARTTRILLGLVIPGHIIFIYTISYMKAGHTTITFHFAWIYLTAAFLQVIILLYLTEWIVHFMWARGIDPDNAAIPYITAVGDMLGTALLALAFYILWNIGDKDADLGD